MLKTSNASYDKSSWDCYLIADSLPQNFDVSLDRLLLCPIVKIQMALQSHGMEEIAHLFVVQISCSQRHLRIDEAFCQHVARHYWTKKPGYTKFLEFLENRLIDGEFRSYHLQSKVSF